MGRLGRDNGPPHPHCLFIPSSLYDIGKIYYKPDNVKSFLKISNEF